MPELRVSPAGAVVGALAGAAIAIIVAMRQLQGARRDLRRDREIDFYLDQIVELGVGFENLIHSRCDHIVMQARMRLLPADLLPLLRALLGVDPDPAAQRRYDALVGKGTDEQRAYLPGRAALIEADVRAEYVKTVERLLAERRSERRKGRITVRGIGLLFGFAVIAAGLSVGLLPRTVEGVQTQCGSAFRPVIAARAECHAELDSRRTLAIYLLALGGSAIVVLPLATRD